MINKEIIINKKTREIINGENGDLFRLGVDGENLQENLVFKFEDEFVNGTARIEITMQNNTKSYVMTNKVNQTYVLPVKSIITKTGLNKMQLVITQGTDDQEIPIFKSKMFSFFIADSINADTEQPEEYPQWIDKANTTLNEIDNFDIDAIKELNEATITITDRYGTTKSVQVFDGENGQDGKDAKINGVNTLRLLAGKNISLEQEDDELTINAEGGSSGGAVNSVNGMTGDVVIEIPDVSDFITKDVNDLTYYEPKATTGNNLVASIDSSTYVMTLTLRNSNNETLNSQTIDLPLETMVVDGEYDSTNKKIILTLKNGNTIEFSVADLVSGLQSEITSSNKLNADLVDDSTSTNKFTNATEKATWNAKSDFSGDYNDLTNKPVIPQDTSYVINIDLYKNYSNPLIITSLKPGAYALYSNSFSSTENIYVKAKEENTDRFLLSLNDFSKQNVLIVYNNVYENGKLAFSYSYNNNLQYMLYRYADNYNSGLLQTADTYAIFKTSRRDSNTISSTNTFTGTNTFNTLPTSSVSPTNDTQFTNKKYVDDQLATKTIQYSTMPTASVDLLDKIVQYIGTTDSTYTNSYFYKCVSDGQETPTYSWENVNVQDGGGSSIVEITANTNIWTLPAGIYYSSSNNIRFYVKNNQYFQMMGYLFIEDFSSTIKYFQGYIAEGRTFVSNASNTLTYGYTSTTGTQAETHFLNYNNVITTDGTQYITAVKTFNVLPRSSVVPSNDADFSNKKYVDDSINNAIGNINTILATLTTPSNNS